MFRGEYYHNIDPKGRLIIPAKFREELGDNFVIAKDSGHCLSIYPLEAWEAFEAKLAQLPRSKSKTVAFFTGGAVDAELDKQGRTLITPTHRKFAELDKEVVLVGMLDRVDIWDKAKYEETMAATEANIEDELDELGF